MDANVEPSSSKPRTVFYCYGGFDELLPRTAAAIKSGTSLPFPEVTELLPGQRVYLEAAHYPEINAMVEKLRKQFWHRTTIFIEMEDKKKYNKIGDLTSCFPEFQVIVQDISTDGCITVRMPMGAFCCVMSLARFYEHVEYALRHNLSGIKFE
jgi:hypothetical protein